MNGKIPSIHNEKRARKVDKAGTDTHVTFKRAWYCKHENEYADRCKFKVI